MFVVFTYLALLASAISLSLGGEYQFFHRKSFADIETVVFCANLTAKRLFNPERRVDVICNEIDGLGDAIARACSRNEPILIGDRALSIKNERIPSYIVVENDRFVATRGTLLHANFGLRTLQYLIVTRSKSREVILFARDLWNADYRDVAFLVFDEGSNGTIIRANVTGYGITLKSVGSCNPFGNDVDRIPAFAADSRRFCPRGGCSVKYGMVADATVRFWRKEDTLKLKRNETLQAVGGLLVEHFGDYYNISIDSSAGINMTWSDAFSRLINRRIDVIVGPRPEDLGILDNLEIVCWYMYRDMVFAGLVHFKSIKNDVLKMLMPFHYLVWLWVILLLISYVLLLIVLKRLSDMGLIKERVKLAYVYAIMLGQGVTMPRNIGLRLVLLLWIVFSLYLSITYNSTFTSSLAEVEKEDLLRDLKQVRDSGQPLGGPAIVRSYFNNSTHGFITDLYERYKVIGAEEAMDSVFTKNGIAVLQHFTVDRINWDYRGNRSLRMYTLPRPVLRFPVFLFTRKGYVYRRPLRQLVTKYRETGMVYKLENVFSIEEDKQIALRQPTDEILSTKHLYPIFQLFFMFQGISCLILLVELLQARMLQAPES